MAAFGQGIEAIPAWANLERYPFMGRSLTPVEQATLGLRPVIVSSPWTGLNWYEARRRFVLETLPVGTLVLSDLDGVPIYKANCGNRLVSLVPPATPPSPKLHPEVAAPPRPSIIERLNALGQRWGWQLAAVAIGVPMAIGGLVMASFLLPVLIVCLPFLFFRGFFRG
jgi:hypothetical protein